MGLAARTGWQKGETFSRAPPGTMEVEAEGGSKINDKPALFLSENISTERYENGPKCWPYYTCISRLYFFVRRNMSRERLFFRRRRVPVVAVIIVVAVLYYNMLGPYGLGSISKVTAGDVVKSLRSFSEKYQLSKSSIWWTNYTDPLSKVYRPWSNHSWCIPETTPTHDWRLNDRDEALGLLYIKTYKASSSTCEGVSLSIAHNVARRVKNSSRPCIHYNRHAFQDIGTLAYRADPSLLWTMVRYPIERDLSSFYFFEVSRKYNVTVTDSFLLGFLRSYKNFQTNYLFPWQSDQMSSSGLLAGADLEGRQKVLGWMQTEIMDKYDFIGLSERFDESLAVMVLLWNLEPSDVIVLSAKQAGGYDDAGDTGRCSKIVRPNPPSLAVREYWSNEHAVDNADFLLWEVANQSLDRTIVHLGKIRVQDMVDTIRKLRVLAEFQCHRKAYFPCNGRGETQMVKSRRSCYVQDAGCGHACVDKTMEKLKRGELELITEKTTWI